MHQFTTKHADALSGTLSGWDRLVLRGTFRRLTSAEGMDSYLAHARVRYQDFGEHVRQVSVRIRRAVEARFQALGRPALYLRSPQQDKEQIARQIAQRDGITQGPICLLSSVEPCYSFQMMGERQTQHLRLVSRYRQCVHLYQYQIHPQWGFVGARIQTWFPLSLQVCLNGREWLARQMDAEGIAYEREDNCFPWIADMARAQQLMDAQLEADWPSLLQQIVGELNPVHEQLFDDFWGAEYYWSVRASEWATDLLFRERTLLQRLYRQWVRHGMTALCSGDVLRFLGHSVCRDGSPRPSFEGAVSSNIKRRDEGIRIKHWVHTNSIKAYDKAYTEVGSVLRVETTLNDADKIKVKSSKLADPNGPKQWQPLRRGIVDLPLRAQVCQQANERYVQALASVDHSATLGELTERITQPTTYNGRRVRALQPFAAEDLALLQAVSRGEFALAGVRNKDLQRLLYATPVDTPQERRRRSACVGRKLRLLRAHGLLLKREHQHVYDITATGRQILTAILTAHQTQVNDLLPNAA